MGVPETSHLVSVGVGKFVNLVLVLPVVVVLL